jgi:hypothetical protein
MSRAALRQAARLSVLLIALSFGLGYLHVGGTFAIWDGATTNASSPLEAGWIPPPTNLATPAPVGYGATLTWTAGASPATGTKVSSADGGTAASASCGTYGSATTVTSPTTVSGTSAANGHWWCYQLASASATAWQSKTAAFTPVRVGLYPVSVAIANGRNSGSLDSGDTIKIVFNQNIASVSGTKVCTFAGASGTGAVLIGDSTCSNSATDSYTIGKLTGVSVGGSGSQSRNATISRSNATISVSVSQNGQTVTGTATFTASTSVTSSVGSAQACTSASAPTCKAVATGGF